MATDPVGRSHVGRVAIARVGWRDALASYLVARGLRLAGTATEAAIIRELAAEWNASQRDRVAKRLADPPTAHPPRTITR